jgi:hypothetical protein
MISTRLNHALHERNYAMNKKVIAREGLIFLATCGALLVLAVILWLFGITLWPLLAGLAPIAIPLYLLVRALFLTSSILRKRRSRS